MYSRSYELTGHQLTSFNIYYNTIYSLFIHASFELVTNYVNYCFKELCNLDFACLAMITDIITHKSLPMMCLNFVSLDVSVYFNLSNNAIQENLNIYFIHYN